MNSSRLLLIVAIAALPLITPALGAPALAQPTPGQPTPGQPTPGQPTPGQTTLSPEQALQLALEANPDLRARLIELERADLLIEREENRREPLLNAEVGYRFGQNPRLSPQGVRLIDTSSLNFAARLGHTLPAGTQLAISAAYGRAVRDTVELGELGIAYDASLGFEVSQPLLRGFGRDIVDAAAESARLSRQGATATQLSEASGVVYSVMTTYWDLWLAQQSLEIQEQALELARQNLANAEARLETGVIAPAELIPIRLEITSVEERLVAARNLVRQRSTELATLLGQDPRQPLAAGGGTPPSLGVPDLDEALAMHRASSPELQRLEIAVASARLQARLAHNDALPRLDAIASASIAGLDRTAFAPIAQLGELDTYIAFVGLRLEMPVVNRSRRAEAERADLAVTAAELELERVHATTEARIVTLLGEAKTARERADLARRSAELARQNVDAQTARFETGRGTSLDVVTALQRYQEAELRVVETEVDTVRRILAIDDLTGTLLERWNVVF